MYQNGVLIAYFLLAILAITFGLHLLFGGMEKSLSAATSRNLVLKSLESTERLRSVKYGMERS